jgi:dihydrofolate reductase
MLISLDGYFEGTNADITWHTVDEEFSEYAIDVLKSLDLLLFGRKTYQLMASYWPTDQAAMDDPIVARYMNKLPKMVFSRTLTAAGWNNTELKKKFDPAELSRIKQLPGKDIAVFGSSDLVLSMMEHRLIDEYRIFVSPIILGAGKPLFAGIQNRFSMKLMHTRTFHSGNVLLSYRAA